LTEELRVELENDILLFTLGFLCFPFPYLGTGLAKAIDAKNRLLKNIIVFVPLARDYVNTGKPPRCLLEQWSLAIGAAAKEKGVSPMEIDGCSDLDIAMTVMDFLFAAQDATNSALSFTADVLATRPDVVEIIRTEVNDQVTPQKPIWSMVRGSDDLEYTCRTANHMLHHKPPVPMIPHLALEATTLGGRTIPKGTILIPSMLNAGKTSGSSAVFDPSVPNRDPQFVRTPIFGGGQHKCPGRRYAESLLTVFLSVFLTEYDFERVGKRPDVDDIMYYPTLFPNENMFFIKPRANDEI
jgi:cytochrome P450